MNDEQRLKAILEKVHKLEIEVNRLHALVERMASSIQTHELVLTDTAGRARVELKTDSGAVELHLLDSQDTYRLTLRVSDDEAMLALCDSDGVGRMGLIVGPDGEASLHIQDDEMQPRVEIYSDSGGRSTLTFYERNLETLWEAPINGTKADTAPKTARKATRKTKKTPKTQPPTWVDPP